MSAILLALLGSAGDPSYELSQTTTALDEGSSVVFTLTTVNVAPLTTFYWEVVTVSGTISGSDFTIGTSTGTFSSNSSGIASQTLTLSNDYATEGTESFQFRVRIDSPSGEIVATSNTVTITDTSLLSYEVAPSTTSLNEGDSVNFLVTTNGVPNTTTLYYTLTNINSNDLSSGSTSGSFTISGATGTYNEGGGATIPITISQDYYTEGSETTQFQLRTGSTSGSIVATSSVVTIADTSTGTYSVTPSTTSVTEGSSMSFTVNTDRSSGTTLYYTLQTISGSISSSDFSSGSTTGSFSVDGSGNATINFTLSSTDGDSGVDQFRMNVRTGSTSGQIVATSSTVTITETETTVSYQILAGGGGGGGAVTADVTAGGGGGGGYLSGNFTMSLSSPYPISIGAGGAAGYGFNPGGKGSNTTFGPITAPGGGCGRGYNGAPDANIGGGCGGGGVACPVQPMAVNYGQGVEGYPGYGGIGAALPSPPGYTHPALVRGAGGGGGGMGGGGTFSPKTTRPSPTSPSPSYYSGTGGSGTFSPLLATVAGGGGGGSNHPSYTSLSGGSGGGGPGYGLNGAPYGIPSLGGSAGGNGTNATAGRGAGGGGAAVAGQAPGLYQYGGSGSSGKLALSKPSSYSWGPAPGLSYSDPSPNVRIFTSGSGTISIN